MAIKGILSWVNPTTNTDGSAFSAATDLAGIQIELDAIPVVSVPVSFGTTSFDMTALQAFLALKSGNHTVALSVVNTSGEASALSAAVTFPVDAIPNPPTGLAVN